VIEAGLKCVQGKAIVNSISMKAGIEKFVAEAKAVRAYGAAVVVMAFDEKGQADTLERRVEICSRAYEILTKDAGFPPEDIIFDPNIFPVATASTNITITASIHRGRAANSQKIPARAYFWRRFKSILFVSRQREGPRGHAFGLSLSRHRRRHGYGIVNAGQLAVYAEIEPELREACEDVVLNRRPDATERLLALAENYKGQGMQAPRRILPGAKSLSQSAWNMRSSAGLPNSSIAMSRKHGPPLPARSTSSKGH